MSEEIKPQTTEEKDLTFKFGSFEISTHGFYTTLGTFLVIIILAFGYFYFKYNNNPDAKKLVEVKQVLNKK